ncbi:MAG TPA: ABC transporter substrate-binding protein [Burkholderiaceae bacterium]|nr:ABC transporter substrate-binding protein [Burkholderiaceae bacterium]
MIRRREFAAAAGGLCTMLALHPRAGFGQSGGQAGSGPYKLAVLASLTGPLSALGVPSKAAIELEVKRLNDAGGIAGRPIELVFGDDQSDPSKGVIAFKRLLDEKPVAMIGPNFSSTALGLIPLVEQARLPMLSMAAEDAQVQPGRKYVFMISLTSRLNAAAILSYLRSSSLRDVALLQDSGAYGRGGARLLTELAPQYNVRIIQTETFNLADTDMTPQLTKVRNNREVQAVIVWAAGAAPATVARQYRSLDLKPPLMLTGAQADPGFAKSAGAAAEGAPFPTARAVLHAFLPPGNGSRRLLDAFVPAYRQATGVDANVFAAVAHDAVLLIAQALRAAPGGDPDALVTALESASFTGGNGEYRFAADAHSGMLPSSVAMAMWKDGRIVPAKPNCAGCFETVAGN